MPKHTPGPWSHKQTRLSSNSSFSVPEALVCVGENGSAGNVVAIVYMGGNGAISYAVDDVEANARLIAAAPDLLAACEALPDFDTEWPDAAEFVDHAQDFVTAMKLARAAIAKVKGDGK